jgi:hypothetical protein
VKAFAEFDRPEDALRAVATLKALGYLDVETYGPFPLTGEDAHAPRGSLLLGMLGFGAGVAALAAAYLIQWYANAASYPLNIGGRPTHASAAFVPSVFESICLAATVAVFVGFLAIERLPRLWQPIFEIDGFERASIDRFWLVLDLGQEAVLDRVRGDLAPLRPLRVVVSEDEP